jgi:glutathione S-transferase
MKLYYSPGACSLAPHIALRETGCEFVLEKVDMRTKQTQSGTRFSTINPKEYVPALQLDNGEILTEVAAVLQYIADVKPESGLAPPAGKMPRYRLQEWLNFISSELHKGFAPLFRPDAPEQVKTQAKTRLQTRFDLVARQLGDRQFLLGDRFTVADVYLYTILGWTGFAGLDRTQWSGLQAYYERIHKRPAVQAARKAEGLKD